MMLILMYFYSGKILYVCDVTTFTEVEDLKTSSTADLQVVKNWFKGSVQCFYGRVNTLSHSRSTYLFVLELSGLSHGLHRQIEFAQFILALL